MAAPVAGAERRSSFFLGFLLLPEPQRRALSAVYAYCRLIDDIVDDGALPKEEAERQLGFWREEISRLYQGKPEHEIARALAEPVARFDIPQEPFLEMIRGCAMDLEGRRYESIAELESYMRGVAGSVGVMCVHIFGWAHTPKERMYEFAQNFGRAFQLTNIIRDVGADLELGRVYLPLEDLRAAGYCVESLMRRERDAAFDRLMRGQYERAKAYYARARELVDERDRVGLLPAELMAHVYEGLLERIKDGGFRVLFEKTSLPAHRKLALALRAWRYCHGL